MSLKPLRVVLIMFDYDERWQGALLGRFGGEVEVGVWTSH